MKSNKRWRNFTIRSTSVSGWDDRLVIGVENLFHFHYSLNLDCRTCKQEVCPRYRNSECHDSIHLTKRKIRALRPRGRRTLPMSPSIPVAIKNRENTSGFPFINLSSLTVNYPRSDVHIRPSMARLGTIMHRKVESIHLITDFQ